MSERLSADQPLRLERPSAALLAAFLAMAREAAPTPRLITMPAAAPINAGLPEWGLA